MPALTRALFQPAIGRSAHRFLVQPLQRLPRAKAPTASWSPHMRTTPSARMSWANSRTFCWPPPRVRPCCSTWTTGNRVGPSPGPRSPRATARSERKLRPRIDGAAHARREWRVHPGGCHRSGALLHRLDHQASPAEREFVFAAFMHDNGEKTVLGHNIPAGGGEQDG